MEIIMIQTAYYAEKILTNKEIVDNNLKDLAAEIINKFNSGDKKRGENYYYSVVI